MELDVLAYANGPINRAYIVEVKSHAREESVTQLKRQLQRFRDFFPEHGDKQVYGTLAAVAAMVVPQDVARYAYRQGLFVMAQSGDDMVILNDATFQPRAW